MTYQNISAKVTTADIQIIKGALATIRHKLPFLVNLTAAERQQLYKTGESRLSFVQNAKAAAENNPGLLPAIFDVAQFASDVNLFAVLTELTMLFKQLVSQSDDTRLAVGAASLAGASQVYKYVQIGVKTTPGLKPLADQLGKVFKRSSQKVPPPPAKQAGNGAVAPRPVILDDRNVTGEARNMTVDSRNMTVDSRSMTVDSRSMTVDSRSMTVDSRSMTVDSRSMTVDSQSMTVDSQSMTVDSQSMTVDSQSMTVDSQSMTVDSRSMTVDSQSMTVDGQTMAVDDRGFLRDVWGIRRQSRNHSILDCGGKRSATPLWPARGRTKSGVAASLCHRTPKLSRP